MQPPAVTLWAPGTDVLCRCAWPASWAVGSRIWPTVTFVLFRRWRFPAGLFLGSLALLLIRWLLPRPIGAADNGDGWRILCHLGGNEPDRISERWVRMAYRPSPPCHSGYVSSQTWLDHVAQWLGHRMGSSAALNLYVLGALSCVLIAAAVTALALALPLSRRGRTIAAGLVLLALADSAVFGWFVSVLSEGAAILGITLMTGGLLVMQRADRWRYVGAVVLFAGSVEALNAKAQTLLLLPVLVLALLVIRKAGRTPLMRWALPVLVLVATAGATVLVQKTGDPAGQEYEQINAYHAIFNSIVRKGSAEADLAELGLPASWAKYQGTQWWAARPTAVTDPAWPQYADRISRHTVLSFYEHHPVRTLQILNVGAQDLLTARPDNIGSFAEGSGMPAEAQEFRVPLLSGVTRLLAPLGLFALAPIWLLIAAAGVLAWRRAQPVAVVVLFLVLAAVDQHVVAALGEGIEGVKHQVIALFCTLLAAMLGVIALLARRGASRSQAPSPAVEADTDARYGRRSVARERVLEPQAGVPHAQS